MSNMEVRMSKVRNQGVHVKVGICAMNKKVNISKSVGGRGQNCQILGYEEIKLVGAPKFAIRIISGGNFCFNFFDF